MKLVLATSNKGKLKEIKALSGSNEVVAYGDLIEEFEIIEDGNTFKENALIKARAVFHALNDDSVVVLADDSGISVDILDGAPGIYSARYAGENVTDVDNLNKLVDAIKAKGVESSPAYYTAAIAIVTKDSEYCVHGWMHGNAMSYKSGNGGFGYDPMFMPIGFDKTLGDIDDATKRKLSHRSKALSLAKVILETL